MKIMIDLDKTVFDCPSIAYALEDFSQGEKVKNKKLKYNIVNKEDSKEYKNLLFFLKMSHAKNFVPADKAIDVLKKWHDQGIEVEFVSSRYNFKSFQRAIVEWLEAHDINFGKIIMGCNNKAEYGRLNNFDVIIDDNLQNCINCKNVGITPIWLRTKYNMYERNKQKDISQAENWQDVDNYVMNLISEELPKC